MSRQEDPATLPEEYAVARLPPALPMTSVRPRYFYQPQQFAQLTALREHLDVIREELQALLTTPVGTGPVAATVAGNFSAWSGDQQFEDVAQQVSTEGGWVKWWNNESPSDPHTTAGVDWTIFGFIYQPGCFIEANCSMCPRTAAILKSLKNVRVSGFSRVNANTTITTHTGFTGRPFGSLAFHMGLIIPPDGTCGFKCGNEVHTWRQPGEMIVFDDTFPHSAWNEHPEQLRVVLYIDFVPEAEEWALFP